MRSQTYQWLVKLLNLREEETSLVFNFLLLNFLQGIGVAFFFITANSLFLAEFKVTYLPYVYLAGALFMLVTGRLYAHFEHVLPLKKFLPVITLVLALSPLLFLLGIFTFEIFWLPFLLLAWHQVMYLLNSLRFWGLSALVFDVRQSKRLFGLISAGDIPAKLLGYLAVSALVPFIGMENLLVISALSFLSGLLVLRNVLGSVGDKLEKESHHTVTSEDNIPGRLAFLKKFFGDHFIIVLSLLSFIATIALTIIDFSFLSEVKYKFKTDEELAYFFGLFFGLGNTATILTKLFFSGRIVNKIGVKYGLLILPVLLLVIAMVINLAGILGGEHRVYLWLFGIMMLVSEVFKYTLHEPVFLTLFQPLNRHQRLNGHNVVKAVINPVGLGISGLILMGFIAYFQGVNLMYISILITVLLIGWILTVIFTNRKYLEILRNAIDQHFIKGSDIAIQDKTTLDHLKNKVQSEEPVEVIHAAEVLEKMDREAFRDVMGSLLRHTSEDVSIFALKKAEQNQILEVSEQVRDIIENSQEDAVKAEAIKAYSQLNADSINFLLPYLEDSDTNIKKGAITGLMKSGSLEGVVMAGQKLLYLNQSEDATERQLGAAIIGEMGIKNFYQPLLELLEDRDETVRETALKSVANVPNLNLLPKLFELTDSPYHSHEVTRVLGSFEQDAVPIIAHEVKNTRNIDFGVKLCTALGQIGGESGTGQLLELLEHPVSRIRMAALQALRKLGYTAKEAEERNQIFGLIDDQLSAASRIIKAQILFDHEQHLEHLQNALTLERQMVARRLFILLTFLYDSHTVTLAEENLEIDDQESRANAIEMLDNLLPKSYCEPLIVLLDERPLGEKSAFLANLYSVPENSAKEFIHTILEKGTHNFTRWTIAITLQGCHEAGVECPESLLKSYASHESELIREVVQQAFSEKVIETNTDNKKDFPMEAHDNKEGKMLNIEKVLILKSTGIFTETPENILVDIAEITHEVKVSAGEQLMQEGEIGRAMYIIHNGEIQIHNEAHTLATLSDRDILGELALLDPEPRSASATAVTDSLLLRIDQQPFYELMTGRMEVASNVLKVLCRRIREQNQKIMELKGTADSN